MRKHLVLLALALQIVVLASMAFRQERLLDTGTTVYLRTAPVDPNDLFRGDYVTLSYEINRVAAGALRGDVREHRLDKGYQVFAVLEPGIGSDDKVYRLAYLTDERPERALYLTGQVVGRNWRWRAPADGVAVRYGIEKLFVEQGSGLAIEERTGLHGGVQVPMEVELAIGADGAAVIRGHRFSAIGVDFEVTRPGTGRPRPAGRAATQITADGTTDGVQARAPEVRVTLHNVGDSTRWLVDPGDHCGFSLVSSGWGADELAMATDACSDVVVTAADLIRLEPGEEHTVTLDLEATRWQVLVGDQGRSIARTGSDWALLDYRLVYRPNEAWQAAALDLDLAGDVVWAGEIYTRAFDPVGQVD